LMSGLKVNDAKAAHSQPDAILRIDSLIIGATMNDGRTHPPKQPGVDLPAFFKLQYASNSAH
jgi:hypothetical protein